MDISCHGAYPVGQQQHQQQLSTIYDPQIPTTSHDQSSSLTNIPQSHQHQPAYYNSPIPPHYHPTPQ